MEDQFTGLVYAALLGETTWQHFLENLAVTVPDGTAGLVVHDTHSSDGYALLSGHGEKAMGHYNHYYAQINPLQPPLASMPVGTASHDDELVPREDLVRTEFFNDFLVPHGLTRTAGVKLAEVGGQSFSLVVGSGDANSEPIRQSVTGLQAIAPHVQRAFGFHGRRRGDFDAKGLLSLFDVADVGAIVLNDERRAVTMSRAARAMLGDLSPLRIAADGRVGFHKQAIQDLCGQMLRRSYAGPESAEFYSHRTKVTLVSIRKSPDLLYFEGPTVVVLLERPGAETVRFDPDFFAEAYGLSKTEMRALSGIVAGHSTDRIAAEADLSRETIRSQIKSLYSKMGVASVADALRLVHRSSCVRVANRDAPWG